MDIGNIYLNATMKLRNTHEYFCLSSLGAKKVFADFIGWGKTERKWSLEK